MSNRNSDRLSKRKSASTSSHTTKDTEIPRPSTSSSHEQSSSGKGKDKEEEEAGVNQQQASGLPGSSVARSAPATTESIRRSDDATIDIFPTQDVSSGHIRAIPGSSSLHWPVNQFDLPESLAAFLQQSQQHDLPLRQQGEEYSTFGQDIRQARSQGDSRRTLQVSQSMPEIINTDLSMQSGPMLRDADISHSDDALRRLPPVSMTAAEYLAYHESPEESMVTSSGSMLQESPGYPTSAGQFDEANMFEMTSPILSSLPHRQLPNQHQVTAWFLPASTQAIYPSQQIVTSPSSYYGGTPAFPSNTFLTPMAAAFAHEYSEQPFASSSSLPSSTLPTTTFPSSSSSASPPLAPPQFPPSISPTSQWPSTEVIPACDLCRKRKVKVRSKYEVVMIGDPGRLAYIPHLIVSFSAIGNNRHVDSVLGKVCDVRRRINYEREDLPQERRKLR